MNPTAHVTPSVILLFSTQKCENNGYFSLRNCSVGECTPNRGADSSPKHEHTAHFPARFAPLSERPQGEEASRKTYPLPCQRNLFSSCPAWNRFFTNALGVVRVDFLESCVIVGGAFEKEGRRGFDSSRTRRHPYGTTGRDDVFLCITRNCF